MNVLKNLFFTYDRPGNERGDTIVEVLIAIGIVSLVLTSAYALTTRNVQAMQEIQEQAYAQKVVEQQVEILRSASTKPTSNGCFSGPNTYVTTPNSACHITNGGATYDIVISLSGATYGIQASWATLGGSNAHVTVYYRVAS